MRFWCFMVVVKLDCVFCCKELLNAYLSFIIINEADSDRGLMLYEIVKFCHIPILVYGYLIDLV